MARVARGRTSASVRHKLPADQKPKGRPKTLDPNSADFRAQIRALAQIHCTQAEAAAVLLVSREEFNRFLSAHSEIRAIWDAGMNFGRASLKRWQFQAAERGNTTMQIWLGKQYLGQRDQAAVNRPTAESENQDNGFETLARALDDIAAIRSIDHAR